MVTPLSVYTQLTEHDMQNLLTQYHLGQLVSFAGVAAGVENTNYRLTLKKDGIETAYFLTLFETLEKGELDFFLPLLAHLQNKDCSLASPVNRINGELVLTIKDKPAAIFNCLDGGHPKVGTEHCQQIGAELARIHLAARDFPQQRDNNRGYYWIQRQVTNRCVDVSDDDFDLMQDEINTIKVQRTQWDEMPNDALPKGIIHGDLFDDNALFADEHAQPKLSGIIDFYNACTDLWVYDLAITVMAWSLMDTSLNAYHQTALINGYESVRPLTDSEQKALPVCLRMAALRFWLSRLHTQKQQQGVAMTTEKAPEQMRDLLKRLRDA